MYIRKLLYILLILNWTLPIVKAQLIQEWAQIYNGPDNLNDNTSDFTYDKFGNVYVTGTIGANPQTSHITTIKYSSAGVQQWAVIYDNPNTITDISSGITLDSLGNIFVTGFTGDLFAEVYDCVLVKYNSNGVQQWVKLYTDAGHRSSPNKILIDKSQHIYIIGTSSASVMALKYNLEGDTLWTRKYIPPGYGLSFGNIAVIDSSGNLIVGGECNINTNAGGDCLILKYSANGTLLWFDTLNTGGVNTSDVINAVCVDNNNNIYVAGVGTYNANALTMKYNPSGIRQWVRWYSGPSASDYANAITIDNIGNILITGSTSNGPPDADYLTIKYNTNGDSLWVRKFDGGNHHEDIAKSITSDTYGNVYITGSCDSNAFIIKTIKYSPAGNQLWVTSHSGNGMKILTDSLNNIYVSGTTSQNGTIDFVTIKYSQLSGINPISSEIPNSYNLSQNYPNPFNPVTIISYDTPENADIKLAVFNIIGEEVKILVDREQTPGHYSVAFNMEGYSSGVYFYKMTSNGNLIDTKKMIMIK